MPTPVASTASRSLCSLVFNAASVRLRSVTFLKIADDPVDPSRRVSSRDERSLEEL